VPVPPVSTVSTSQPTAKTVTQTPPAQKKGTQTTVLPSDKLAQAQQKPAGDYVKLLNPLNNFGAPSTTTPCDPDTQSCSKPSTLISK
jgi:hypothetical protein